MPADWTIQRWPPCSFHVFLSHAAEDRDRLVIPVYRALLERGLLPWIDRHHYPAGRDSFEALREELAACRHVVYVITPALLRQGWGWVAAERAYASPIQRRLIRRSLELCHVELPLLFVPRHHPVLSRSIWSSVLDRSAAFQDSARSVARQIEWSVETIARFLRREAAWGLQLADHIDRDQKLARDLTDDPHLRDRVVAAMPVPVPPDRIPIV